MVKKKNKSNVNEKITFGIVCFVFLLILGMLCFVYIYKHSKVSTFKFTEYVGTISNPGIGYTRTHSIHAAPNNTNVHDVSGDIILFFIDIGQFSSGMNSEKVDYDFDQKFFDSLRKTFEICRNNGSTIGVRFRYDENGVQNPEPSTFDQVLRHVAQIKESGVFEEYKDMIMFVESGFVGAYGEQWGGKYTTTEHKAQLLDALLDAIPAPIPVTVRTPDIFAKWAGIELKDIAEYKSEPNSKASRVGLYDDGYMGSDTDLGTYRYSREKETTWLGNQTLTSYFGGEFSGNLNFAKQYNTYLPENAIPEMYKTHLSYINGNIFQLHKDYTFGKNYDVQGLDNSAYYGQNCFQFIRDHLGYRFVLKESHIPKRVKQGTWLNFDFSLVNNGFANPTKKQTCEIILEKDGAFISTVVDIDPTTWYSGKTTNISLNLKLPGFLEVGKWNIYLKSSVNNLGLDCYHTRSIRFANNNVWNENLGANYIGNVKVVKNKKASNITDNTFYQKDHSPVEARLVTLGNGVVVDGKNSYDTEWSDTDIIATTNNYNLYARADEENLYIKANLSGGATRPVYNIRIGNALNNDSYWIYKQGGGQIYYNHQNEFGKVGLEIEGTDQACEFKIPLYMLEMDSDPAIKNIRFFLQDETTAGWPLVQEIKTDTPKTIKRDFKVYTACENLTLKKSSTYSIPLQMQTDVQEIKYYHNGKQIDWANGNVLTLTNVNKTNNGLYTATITTVTGATKEIKIANINVI